MMLRDLLCAVTFCVACVVNHAATPSDLTVRSPDGQVVVTFALRDRDGNPSCPTYAVAYAGQPVLQPSRLGVDLGGLSLLSALAVAGHAVEDQDTSWRPVCGERSMVRDHFRCLVVDLVGIEEPLRKLRVTFRVYNEGVAFALTVPPQDGLATAAIRREQSEFRFAENHSAWATYSAQGEYRKVKLSQLRPGCERPLVIQMADDRFVALAEAKLVDYARMKLAPLAGVEHALVSQLDGEVLGSLPLTTPWRVILIGNSPAQLLENNFLLQNLNAPCAIADTSWIRPGKVIREVTLTTEGGKTCVDFAVQRGLQYVEFDAGWYGHEYDEAADATTVTVDPKRSKGPLDLPAVIRYADERGIGIIVYVNRRALEQQLETILPLYRSWGIRGVKYGFVNVGSQQWTRWLHDAIRLAAENQLMVDVHDEYRPTGFSRTYPNLMTMEGIRGDEARPSAEQTLTTLFTRMLAGRGDNTICYYDKRVTQLWSHGFQLAKGVCFFSPWQFLFWYDRPSSIQDTPDLELFRRLPTSWDETRVLEGVVGERAVIARRRDREWYVGVMNAGSDREFAVPLSFLAPGKSYALKLYVDDPRTDTPTQVSVKTSTVSFEDTLKLSVRRNHGAALHLQTR